MVIIYILERVWVLLFLGVGDEGGFHEVRVSWGLGSEGFSLVSSRRDGRARYGGRCIGRDCD